MIYLTPNGDTGKRPGLFDSNPFPSPNCIIDHATPPPLFAAFHIQSRNRSLAMKLIQSIVFISLLTAASHTMAATCGAGKITHVKEGGWNSNDLMIAIDYSVEPAATEALENSTWEGQWIRFRANVLDAERLKALRSLAYLAFASGTHVKTNTHNDDCSSATEITIY